MDTWNIKTNIYLGEDSFKELERLSKKNIFIVCDPFLVKDPIFEKLTDCLKKQDNTIKIFSDVTPNPPIEDIVASIEEIKGFDPQIMIAIGGGSAIDLAKGVLYFSRMTIHSHPEEFIAIPTTSGTGSEVTNVSVITDTQNNIKYPIADDSILPDTAILNPKLLLSCPQSVTVYSGLDVLTHALEALVATKSNVFTDSMAEKAIELVFDYLYECYIDGNNIDNRMKMHEASCLAGIAFNDAGLGISHAIAHQLGGQFHVIHGLANAILLPRVVQFNSTNPIAKQKYSNVAIKLGLADRNASQEEAVTALVGGILELALKLKCPITLQECGVKKDDALAAEQSIVKNALNDITARTNPVKASVENLTQVYRKII